MNDAIPILRVVCALVEHPEEPGRILVAQRPASDCRLPLKWEFPGGKVEVGESNAEALRREIFEEFELTIKVGASLTPTRWRASEDLVIELAPFLCQTEKIQFHLHEHADAKWLSPEEMKSLDWAPADLPIVGEWLDRKIS